MPGIELPSIITPPFSGFAVSKHNGQLMFVEGRNYEQRNQCTRQLIADVVSKFQVPDFGWTIVNTDDMDLYKTYFGYRVLCFSTFNGDFSQTVPDFTYGGWPEVGIDSFEGTCASMEAGGMDPYAMNAIGWRGALTHYNRRLIVQMHDGANIDAIWIEWDTTNPERLVCRNNFVSLPDHPRRWRFLIDVEAHGWSGRLKFFFFANRPVFIQDRPYKEWYFQHLKPWVHYVPVARDMSDLRANMERVRADHALEMSLRRNALEFAKTRLSRDAAHERWAEALRSLA